MNRFSSRFRLNSQDGKIMGVCAGLADYTGIDALWIRVGAVLLTIGLTALTIPAYIAIGVLADSNRF